MQKNVIIVPFVSPLYQFIPHNYLIVSRISPFFANMAREIAINL